MKFKNVLPLIFLLLSTSVYSTKWTITNSGFTFSPSTLTITQGDTVIFSLGGQHNSVEVSQTTWNSNGNTPLAGGWQTSFGGGTVLPLQLTVGTHFYVCNPHASMGMKGQIIVQLASGLSENTISNNLAVFPNPASDVITVKGKTNPSGINYIVSDQNGKQVLSGTLLYETAIDINRLEPGIYFLIAGQERKQFIKVDKK